MPAAETMVFQLRPQCDRAASTDKKLIERRSSNNMKLTTNPKENINLCILVIPA